MRQPAAIIVLAGVSGSGKSTVGRALASRLGCMFKEGDALHPPANVAKMAAGIPLDDADRQPWLAEVADWIRRRADLDESGVISCSALRRRYRDRLRDAAPGRLACVLLDPPAPVLRARLAARRGHFMPAALLDSQLATLERPGAGEDMLLLRHVDPAAAACDAICAWLDSRVRRAGS